MKPYKHLAESVDFFFLQAIKTPSEPEKRPEGDKNSITVPSGITHLLKVPILLSKPNSKHSVLSFSLQDEKTQDKYTQTHKINKHTHTQAKTN
jgi:hypothetical protein